MPKSKKEGSSSKTPSSNDLKKHLEHLTKLEGKMIENMNSLQKVQINIAEKFDGLTKELSKLLGLFETTAQIFANDPMHQITDKDTEFLEKVNQVLDQNKTIAKGLTIMEDKLRNREYPELPRYTTPVREVHAPQPTQQNVPAHMPSQMFQQTQPMPIEQDEDPEPSAPSSPKKLPKF
jgi:conjugal transfer/entry exclusion protein